jgi:hypothetical protein
LLKIVSFASLIICLSITFVDLGPELKKPLIEDLTPQNAHAITFADHHRGSGDAFPKLYLTGSRYLAILHSFDAFFMAYGKIPNLEPLAVAE